MGRFSRAGNELYQGTRSIDFVGRRALWYSISGTIVAACIAIVALNGFHFGIEFTGGTQFRIDQTSGSVSQSDADRLRDAIADGDFKEAGVPIVTTSGDRSLIVQVEPLPHDENERLTQLITDTTGVAQGDVSQDEIGASWGREVAQRAILGVVIFLSLVVLFIWGYFREWKMSVAALAALAHDILVTIGVYSLSGFPVTPAAVTGLLAILGFSMYDTVVVFDKVRENTHELRRSNQSYRDAANLAVNQTLVRSINTSIVALIPIGSILYVSAVQLGASSLQDLALAQFVGMAVGVFSSVCVAPRLLVHMKESEPDVQSADRRAKARARRQADRYADVPVFTEGMPVRDPDLGDPSGTGARAPGEGDAERPTTVFRAPTTPRDGSGSGRVVPTPKAPIEKSGAAKRNQPSRQPRSRRGK